MKGRPLCSVCLVILCIYGIRLLFISGDTMYGVPADSIFIEDGKYVLVQGKVYKKSNTPKNQVIYLKNNSITYQNQIYNESKIIVYDKSFFNIPIGATIQIYGKLGTFEQARNPGNFDTQKYYAKQGIYGFCNLEEIINIGGEKDVVKEHLFQFRQKWKGLLLNSMSERNGPILSAMILAEKAEIDSEVKELYQRNGISHILAISGLHVSFVGLGIYQSLRRKMHLSYGLAGSIAILVLGMYILMIGFSISVIRAFIMLCLRIGADITGRVYDMLTALLLSATILVIYNPCYMTDAAFYMSHGAIVGIVLMLPQLKKMWRIPRFIPRKFIPILEGCLSSIAINVTLFPVLIYFYYEIPTYSVLVNAFIIPMMSVVLSLGMFGSLVGMHIPNIACVLFQICDVILRVFEWICKFGGTLPFSSLVLGRPKWWNIVLYYCILLALLLVKKERIKRKKTYIGCTLIISCFLFVNIPDGKLHITVLDVGQGDCIFIQGPLGKTYLIDGGSSDEKQVGKYRIEPYLKSIGVGSLDYVFLSHGDTDHCNGIREMLERQTVGVKIKNIVLPVNYQQEEELLVLAKMALVQRVNVLVFEAGEELKEEKLTIRCLQPNNSERVLCGNAGSMVLSVAYDEFDMLFTGDVEAEGEELLVEKLETKYDALKVSHHGSRNSTSKVFLEKISPKVAFVSAGENNSYGHPHEETIERLRGTQCLIFQTAECGAVSLTVGKDLEVKRWID